MDMHASSTRCNFISIVIVIVIVITLACAALLGICTPAAADEHDQAGDTTTADVDRFTVAFDEQKHIATLMIDAPAGELAWADLLRGLARMKGFEDRALIGLLPGETVELDGVTTRLLMGSVDAALGEGIDLEVVDEDGDSPRLRITMDRIALLESKRKLKARLRNAVLDVRKLVGMDGASNRGLTLHENWQQADPDKPIVIFVHGLNTNGDKRGAWLASLRERGYPTGRFMYPDDAPLRTSGAELAAGLNALAQRRPRRAVTLITFSMGGLVAREAIENPAHAPPNVHELIMVAPPNRGSELARFAFALEITEYIAELEEREPIEALVRTVEDGLGEASNDLMPRSPFLQRLNQRERNPDVQYSILLGTGGPLTAPQLALLRQGVRAAGDDNRFVRFFGPKVLGWLEDLDEVVQGKGDGAVAVKRGKLEGVDDVVVLPFDHATVLEGAPTTDIERRLRAAVMQRLSDERPAASQPADG